MIIGLVGKIASGKSYARKVIANTGIYTIDVDDITHEFIRVYDREIAKEIFKNKKLLRKIKDIVTPTVIKRITDAEIKYKFIVVEIPTIFFDLFQEHIDKIIYIGIDRTHQIERLKQRNYNEDDIENRIKEHEKAESNFFKKYSYITRYYINNEHSNPFILYTRTLDILKCISSET